MGNACITVSTYFRAREKSNIRTTPRRARIGESSGCSALSIGGFEVAQKTNNQPSLTAAKHTGQEPRGQTLAAGTLFSVAEAWPAAPSEEKSPPVLETPAPLPSPFTNNPPANTSRPRGSQEAGGHIVLPSGGA